MKPDWRFLTAAALYMGAIFWLSAQPGDRVGIPAPWDKLVHATAYAVLGALLQLGLGRPAVAWVAAALYGLSDEVHQYFVPGRMFDLGDWLADAVGAALGAYWALRWRKVSNTVKASDTTTTVPTARSK